MMVWWLAGSLALITSVTMTGVVRRYALRVLLDCPNERSSHAIPTPRGGGLGLVLGVITGCACVAVLDPAVSVGVMLFLLTPIVGMAALGWWDDHAQVPASRRLMVQFGLVALAVAWFGVPERVVIGRWSLSMTALVWWPLAVVGGVWLVNLTNFMDGIDGIAATQGIIGSAGMVILGTGVAMSQTWQPVQGLLITTVGASLGFLVWNCPPARIFMGDVGSTALGLIFAIGVLALLEHGVGVDVALLPIMPFTADATCTLARRAWRGERLSQAHRSHLYQRLARHWGSHGAVTGLYGGFAGLGCGLAWLTARGWLPGGVGVVLWCLPFALLIWYGQRVAPSQPVASSR